MAVLTIMELPIEYKSETIVGGNIPADRGVVKRETLPHRERTAGR